MHIIDDKCDELCFQDIMELLYFAFQNKISYNVINCTYT